MESALEFISNDKTVICNTVQDINGFTSQSLATQVKKREQLFSMIPAFKKAYDLVGDDIAELSTEDESLNNKTGSHDGKWLEESKAKLLFKQIDDGKRAKLIMSRKENQMKKKLNGFL